MGRRLRCAFMRRSVLDMDEREPFDAIYMEQALHHIEPRRALIDKLRRLVKPGGTLIISEANGWNPLLQWSLFRLRGTNTIITHEGHVWGHERVTVPLALTRSLKRRGFASLSLEYYRALPNVALADRLLPIDRNLPQFLRPAFTHFNLVMRRSGA